MTTLPHSISPPPVTLFVVDDDEVDRETIVRSVEDMGLDNPVRTARDGEEALAILRGDGAEPLRGQYLILLDLNMPRLNGKACLARLRADERTMDLPVIILSTSDSPEDISDSYRLHASFYLVKPGDFSELVEAFQSLREFWFEQAAQPDTEREESVAGPSD